MTEIKKTSEKRVLPASKSSETGVFVKSREGEIRTKGVAASGRPPLPRPSRPSK